MVPRITPRGLAALLALGLLAPALVFASPAAAAPAATFDFGSDIAIGTAWSHTARKPAMDAALASGMTIFFSDAKDGTGKAGWYTTAYPMSGAYAPGDGAVERAAADAHKNGLKSAVRFATFIDKNAAAKFPHARVAGTDYLDPACKDVRAHMIGMLKDLVARTKVDEVNLDYVRYNPTLSSTAPLPCTGGTVGQVTDARNDHIASFVKEASAAIKAIRPEVKLSASVFPQSLQKPLTPYGQDAVRMSPGIDVFMPMIYPMNFAGQDPYKLTYDFVASGVSRLGAEKVRPWIQGESTYAGQVAPVCNQIKAVAAAGGAGAFVWWFHTMGFNVDMWKQIGAC
ncbi:MAG TPA: putative glycoside hydrolase, partial [Candidatus Thermoplasmatota archaeon]|nr:putative glycoside hydrolase [Candidatus Thermoplasmatota archaeon]